MTLLDQFKYRKKLSVAAANQIAGNEKYHYRLYITFTQIKNKFHRPER